MYGTTLFVGFMNGSSVQPVVAVERTVFYRERAAGMYSAFPYAFGQVKTIFNNVRLFIFWISGHDIHLLLAGCHWTPLWVGSGYHIRDHSLFDDWIWVDWCQILLVPLLHVLLATLLHIPWHDGRGPNTKLSNGRNHLLRILRHLEHFFWCICPSASKCPVLICLQRFDPSFCFLIKKP